MSEHINVLSGSKEVYEENKESNLAKVKDIFFLERIAKGRRNDI